MATDVAARGLDIDGVKTVSFTLVAVRKRGDVLDWNRRPLPSFSGDKLHDAVYDEALRPPRWTDSESWSFRTVRVSGWRDRTEDPEGGRQVSKDRRQSSSPSTRYVDGVS